MSIYPGQLFDNRIKGLTRAVRSFLSPSFQTADLTLFDEKIFPVSSPFLGSSYFRDPDIIINVYDGLQSGAVNFVFYDRFLIVYDLIIVTAVDVGAVAIEGEFSFGIWNGYPTKETIAGISLTQPDAISLTGFSVGTVFGPYQEYEITLEILSGASSLIDCDITVVFVSGKSTTFTITATVAIDLFFRPQRTSCIEFVEFLTDVITSYNGSEQRRALRRFPRENFAVRYLEPDQNRRTTMKNALIGGSGQKLGFPFWHMANRVVAQPIIGDGVIYVDTQYADYQADGLCMLYDEVTTARQTIKILSFTGTSIILSGEVAANYADCLVMPYYVIDLSTPVTWQDTTNYTEFDLEGMMSTPLPVAEYLFDLYSGKGVLPYECNLFEDNMTPFSVKNVYDEFDSGTGTFGKTGQWASAKLTSKFGVHATTKEQCYTIREILYYLRGRQRPLWVPTFETDFIPTADLGGTTLVCERNEFQKYLFGKLHDNIAIYRNGEPPVYTKITAAVDNGTNLVLTVQDLLPVAPKESVKISTMLLCRLDSDTTEIEWVSPSECYCNLDLISVEE